MSPDRATEVVRRRYNRVAPLYDLMESIIERPVSRLRGMQWSKVEGKKVLEVGVGTGKNMPHYPKGIEVTAIDISQGMMERARRRAARLGLPVTFELMDAQDLKFPDNSFDSVAATFVFCSVPDPVRGLTEIKRVLKPGGKVVLLEHVLSDRPVMAWFMNAINPIVSRIGGENINRRTVENVARSGLVIERVSSFAGGLAKIIEARKPVEGDPRK